MSADLFTRSGESGLKTSRLTRDEVDHLIETHFPQVNAGGKLIFIEAVGGKRARLRMAGSDRIARPGGTISGPAMVMLADVGLYVAILGELGQSALQAVTTNLSINFLKRPPATDLLADVTLIKVGRRLVVGEVAILSEADGEMVAHLTATYALPIDR